MLRVTVELVFPQHSYILQLGAAYHCGVGSPQHKLIGRVVEDASWLRKEADHSHINVAELEAVGRGDQFGNCLGIQDLYVGN